MEMREIEIFRAVMQTGSTSKAASLLDISQPAVSQSIKKLEMELPEHQQTGIAHRLASPESGENQPIQRVVALFS